MVAFPGASAYLFAVLALVVVLFYFTIFAFIVTHRGTRNWDKIRSCLQDSKVCRSLQNKNETIAQLSSGNSWAVEKDPSVNGENESPRSLGDATERDEDGGSVAADGLLTLVNSEGQAAGSQNNVEQASSKIIDDRRVLSAMIGIVDPEFRKQMSRSGAGNEEPMSDAEADEGVEEGDSDSGSDGSDNEEARALCT
ncbi:hypothetical protein Zm00014a_044005 [Zea mays]|uniref:Uncharacterized protein n=1 Tax=Zea mays TaxID=4577 RepID=A0A3L6E4U5_MAIZE|nr:hypothetical protein Zm00014a_044005 [Zea mays]